MQTVPPVLPAIVILSMAITRLIAAPGEDQLRFEQPYDMSGSASSVGSLWDPSLWRNLTTPAESPVLPASGNFLRFYSKMHDGTPLATPAQNMTIKTAAALGFSPPVAVPDFSKLGFSGNLLRFDGTPDEPGDPFGRLDTSSGLGMTVESSSIEFDHTALNISGLLINGTDYDDPPHSVQGSGIQLTGNVGPGYSHNLLNSGTTAISRQGAGPVSPVLLRENATAWLAGETTYGFTLHPTKPNTGNAPVFRSESGGQLILGSVALANPTGVIFDVDAGSGASSIVSGSVSTTGTLEDADPLVLFRATGSGALPASPSLLVNQISHFRDLTGTFARASNHSWISLASEMWFDGDDNILSIVAESGGQVTFDRMRTTYPSYSIDGSVQLDWSADGGGLIDGGLPTSSILHLNGSAHSFTAAGGAAIRLPPNLGADGGATLTMTATGAGTLISCPNSLEMQAWNLVGPQWDHYTISLASGATLRGGAMETYGDYSYPMNRTMAIVGHASPSSITATDSNIGYLNSILSGPLDVDITGSEQRHVSWSLGSGADFTMSGGTWRPENQDVLYFSQNIDAGGANGDSHITLTSAATAHAVTISIGDGTFGDGGDPPPFDPCTLTVEGGSTWTGDLFAATAGSGEADVLITGEGTTVGLDKANLGATAFPIQYVPGQDPGFYINTGGTADLTLATGARLSVGSYTDAFGNWQRIDTFGLASMIIKDGDVTIDGTSAAFIGDAVDASAVDHREGALVIGPGGHLLGAFEVFGSAADGNDLVVAGGTVLPGFSPGEITVDGNFLMESGTLVMEVENDLPGGCDRISAERITIDGGTIRIVPSPDITPSATFTVDLFATPNLDIDPGVTIEIDPALGAATFDPVTGQVTVTSSGTKPTVTINQKDGQADPTTTSPIEFTVVFSESVTSFDGSDVTPGGTAGATTAVVTGSGTTYTVEVSGMTGSGTVTASIPVDVVDGGNEASTSTDNEITYAPVTGFALWQQLNGTSGALDLDHDGDGVSNGVEYFLGGGADTSGPTALPAVVNTAGVLSITWTKAADYTGAYGTDFRVETSDTLAGGWTTESVGVTVAVNGNNVTYTFPTPPSARKFVRLAVTGP